MSTDNAHRLILISDSRLFREGLECLISRDGRLDVVATFAGLPLREGVVTGLAPDVVLLDVCTFGALGFVDATVRPAGAPKVIALGLTESEEEFLPYAEFGAAGYVSREGTIEDIVEVVTCALRDELSCSRQVAAQLMRRVAHLAGTAPDLGPVDTRRSLTARERQIGELLQRGLNNKHIATALHISVSTVKNHVYSILDKLSASSRVEAAALLRGSARRLPAIDLPHADSRAL